MSQSANNVGRFLCGIAALVWSPDSRQYLILRRSAQRDAGAGEWECVTGRVDQGESFETALHREVREELGVAVRIEALIGTAHFYRGAPVPENELLSAIYLCSLADPGAVEMSAEHDEMRWLDAAGAAAFLPSDHWLAAAIRRAQAIIDHTPAVLRDLYHREGFELD
jgi:8-oxo-dGTP diphosphatase